MALYKNQCSDNEKYQREWFDWSQSENIASMAMALEEGQDINEIVLNGLTSASISALGGHMMLFEFLREKGADFNKLDGNKMSTLMCSAHAGTVKIAAKILSKGDPAKTLAAANDDGQTALHFAAKSGRAEMVQFLLSKGADPNLQDNQGNTALHMSMLGGSPLAVTVLLKGGAESVANKSGHTPEKTRGALAACRQALQDQTTSPGYGSGFPSL